MPDVQTAFAVLLLAMLVEASPLVRLPLALALAVAVLATGAQLAPVVVLGSLGVVAGRLLLALRGRRQGDAAGGASGSAATRRAALRSRLAASPGYARTTFVLAALPGIPADAAFPLLGAMRAPLLPALAGTLVGRLPVLAAGTALVVWLAGAVTRDDQQAAMLVGAAALLTLSLRLLAAVDWEHRAATGRWRLREPAGLGRVTSVLRDQGATTWGHATRSPAGGTDEDVIDVDVLDEESPDADEPPAGELPPSRGS